jgi:hypothetical protein
MYSASGMVITKPLICYGADLADVYREVQGPHRQESLLQDGSAEIRSLEISGVRMDLGWRIWASWSIIWQC